MADKLGKIVEGVPKYGGSAASAAVGAGIGTLIAGPIGTVTGAMVGTAVEHVIQFAGQEIKEKVLSKSEKRKIGTVYECAKEKINRNLDEGKTLRTDDFFNPSTDGRSSADEILEGTLFAAQRENEEKKLPYMANLYANINFDESIDRHMANQLIHIASELSYRQLVILRVIGAYQTGDLVGAPPRRSTEYGTITGYDNISIATDIFDLYRRSLVFSQSAILDAAGIIPSKLTISGMGALLYNLMDLPHMPYDELANTIVTFLSGVSLNIKKKPGSIKEVEHDNEWGRF